MSSDETTRSPRKLVLSRETLKRLDQCVHVLGPSERCASKPCPTHDCTVVVGCGVAPVTQVGTGCIRQASAEAPPLTRIARLRAR
jgi:hypothetical protein